MPVAEGVPLLLGVGDGSSVWPVEAGRKGVEIAVAPRDGEAPACTGPEAAAAGVDCVSGVAVTEPVTVGELGGTPVGIGVPTVSVDVEGNGVWVGVAVLTVPVGVGGTGVAVGGTAVLVGGTGVFVGGTGVLVGGTAVLVGGTGVLLGGTGVLVGGTDVFVGGTGVFVGGTDVLVGGTGVLVGGIGVLVGGAGVLVGGMGVLVGACWLTPHPGPSPPWGCPDASLGLEQSGAALPDVKNPPAPTTRMATKARTMAVTNRFPALLASFPTAPRSLTG